MHMWRWKITEIQNTDTIENVYIFLNAVIQSILIDLLLSLFFSGATTAAEWLKLRTAPGPWTELEFENIVLTVPSHVVRGLEHPEEVAALWDEIMRAIADLAAKSHKFPHKERFVTDVQISAGKCTLTPKDMKLVPTHCGWQTI